MVEKNISQTAPEERIGTAAHPMRNLLVGVVAVAGVGLLTLFYWSSAKSDATAIKELHGFRQTMADKCKQEQFAKPATPQLESLYADSSRMQTVIRDQLGNLQRGSVDCDHVMKSLKSVDYPVE